MAAFKQPKLRSGGVEPAAVAPNNKAGMPACARLLNKGGTSTCAQLITSGGNTEPTRVSPKTKAVGPGQLKALRAMEASSSACGNAGITDPRWTALLASKGASENVSAEASGGGARRVACNAERARSRCAGLCRRSGKSSCTAPKADVPELIHARLRANITGPVQA